MLLNVEFSNFLQITKPKFEIIKIYTIRFKDIEKMFAQIPHSCKSKFSILANPSFLYLANSSFLYLENPSGSIP